MLRALCVCACWVSLVCCQCWGGAGSEGGGGAAACSSVLRSTSPLPAPMLVEQSATLHARSLRVPLPHADGHLPGEQASHSRCSSRRGRSGDSLRRQRRPPPAPREQQQRQ